MVLIQYKKNEKNSFILDFGCETTVSDVISRILEVNNMRLVLFRLAKSLEELANKGVLKPSELQGLSFQDIEKHPQEIAKLDEQKMEYARKPTVEAPYRFVPDKNNARYGVILSKQDTEPLLKAANFALKVLEPKIATTTIAELDEALDSMRQAVMVAYPGYFGLPSWEPVVLLLENQVQIELVATQDYEYFTPQANLWWAGKQLDKHKTIGEYTGKNEKTKITVKLQNPGAQQPPREPPIDIETYKKMVDYYQKKTNEAKEFEKNALNEQYEKPQWANKNLKQQLTLSGQNILYKPF